MHKLTTLWRLTQSWLDQALPAFHPTDNWRQALPAFPSYPTDNWRQAHP